MTKQDWYIEWKLAEKEGWKEYAEACKKKYLTITKKSCILQTK